MISATQVGGYYTLSGNLYAEGTDARLQNEARQATAVVISMINQNDKARREVSKWAESTAVASAETAYIFTAVTLDTLTEPWFWLSMHLMTRPTSFGAGGMHAGGGCCSPGSCSGGGCDGDGCKAALLILAIGILVAAFVASVGLTVKHGMDAEEARKKANEIKQLRQEARDERVQQIYGKIEWEQNKEWASQTLKTTFTATCAAGVGFLTVSACFALYAVLNRSPMSPYATLFAIVGGAGVGGGLAAHTIRGIVLQARKGRDLEILHELYNDIMGLEAPHPYRILAETGQDQATLIVGEYLYIKNGETFRKEHLGPLPAYVTPSAPPAYELPPAYDNYEQYAVADRT